MRADAIRLARVSSRLAGAPRLRSALERWVGDCDPSRHGLPPQAIVLVRRMRTTWSHVVADDRATRYASFATMLTGARRPVLDDADADVVWFADEAELLACIARDALSGALRGRWWWRALATSESEPSPEIARWLHSPRQVPQAVKRLGAARARAWIASWPQREQDALLTALTQVYPISRPVVFWVQNRVIRSSSATPVAAGAAPLDTSDVLARVGEPEKFTTPAERLHELCAALAEDASAARTSKLATLIAARMSTRTEIAARPGANALPAPGAVAHAATSTAISRAIGADDPAHEAAPPLRVLSLASRADTRQSARGSSAHESPNSPAMPNGDDRHTLQSPIPQAFSAASGAAFADDQRLAELPAYTSIRTRYGGLMFVLNAALQLSLYGDFTQPTHIGLPCTPWRFLWLAGHAWCGAAFRADPLATWLDKRDASTGRRHDAPTNSDWRIDEAWLEPFASEAGVWRARWQEGRFTLLHPAGFSVCDLQASADRCEALIGSEAARLGLSFEEGVQRTVVAKRARSRRPNIPRPRHGCPEPLWPYLHARLALALDDGRATAPRRRVAAMLNVHAQLHASSSERLDLNFSLDALPLAIRLAGLDRDPGWIPSAGCDVRFHFE